MEEAKREDTAIPEAGKPKVDGFEKIAKEVRKPKPKKRKPGRPTEAERKAREAEEKAEEAAQLAVDVSAIRGMLEWIFGSLLAARFGPHWKLRSDEAEAGAQAWGGVLNKYSPAAGRFLEEIRAGIWTMGAVGPRWEKTKQIMMEQAAKAETEGSPTPPKDLSKDQAEWNKKAVGQSE